MQAHRAVREVEENELSEYETSMILASLDKLDLGPAQIDIGILVAGTRYRGMFETRLKGIINECKKLKNIVILIDEIHTLMGAGAGDGSGAGDGPGVFPPQLGQLQLGMWMLGAFQSGAFQFGHFQSGVCTSGAFHCGVPLS